MSAFKQKKCVTNWLKKSGKEKDKKIQEEQLLTLPEYEWHMSFF